MLAGITGATVTEGSGSTHTHWHPYAHTHNIWAIAPNAHPTANTHPTTHPGRVTPRYGCVTYPKKCECIEQLTPPKHTQKHTRPRYTALRVRYIYLPLSHRSPLSASCGSKPYAPEACCALPSSVARRALLAPSARQRTPWRSTASSPSGCCPSSPQGLSRGHRCRISRRRRGPVVYKVRYHDSYPRRPPTRTTNLERSLGATDCGVTTATSPSQSKACNSLESSPKHRGNCRE